MPTLPTTTRHRRAVIDIGTNSVKLLIGDCVNDQVVPVFETSEQTRLGRDFYRTHQLQEAAVATTARTVARFAAQARQWEVDSIRLIATSAARDAQNPEILLDAVWQSTGLRLEVISGRQEADWAYRGVASDPALAGQSLLIVDAGGGSTEFILGEGAGTTFRRSFQLGTVRLLERLPVFVDPPGEEDWRACALAIKEAMTQQVLPAIAPHFASLAAQRWLAVGSSGTATVLAKLERQHDAYERAVLEGTELSRDRLREWRQRLWSLPLATRRQLPGLPPERADVILPGVAIYESVLDHFRCPRLRISTRSLRYGALLEE